VFIDDGLVQRVFAFEQARALDISIALSGQCAKKARRFLEAIFVDFHETGFLILFPLGSCDAPKSSGVTYSST